VADISSIQLGLSLYYNQNTIGYPISLSSLSSKYVPSDSLIDPNGNPYLYVPLTKGTGANPKCTYYHLGTLLELSSSQIDQNDTFTTLVADNITNDYKRCDGTAAAGIDGDNILMYSVHP
jgi:hypothetical protein